MNKILTLRGSSPVMVSAADAAGERPSTFRWTHGLLNRLVCASDAAMIVLAALLAPLVWPQPLDWPQQAVVVLAEIWAFIALLGRIGAYRVEHYTTFWKQFRHLLVGAAGAAAVALLVLAAFLEDFRPAEDWMLSWQGLQFLLLLANRQFQHVMIRLVEQRHLLRRKTVVIGANAVGEAALRELAAPGSAAGYEVVGLYRTGSDDPAVTSLAGIPVSGRVEELAAYAQHHTIDLIVLAQGWDKAPEIFRLMATVEWIAADVVIPFEEAGVRPSFARIANVAGLSTLQVMYRPFKGSQGITKAAEDYVVAGLSLLLLSPLLMLVALAIKLESPGPVMFRQPRTGIGQQSFSIFKFRTMTVDPSDDGTVGTNSRHNPRITRVGGILRRYSIDEIPQLINVLRGEMSIVGPRPYVANMLVGQERFADMVRRYATRHRIKPGLTGYAQANGMRSNALRDPENARKSVEMDIYYITHWSLWLDIRIMLRTIFTGLTGKNVF
jgi:putative colanic acid biosynthesis UDP-glucose lipid carrier transferase